METEREQGALSGGSGTSLGPADGKIAPGNKSLRILLVEDEMLIRLATAEMFAELGHTVIEAGDAEEALKLLDENNADLLFTDIGLPRISGAELAAEVRKKLPDLPIIFASGYSGTTERDDPMMDGAVILSKPFDTRQLVSALDQAATARPLQG